MQVRYGYTDHMPEREGNPPLGGSSILWVTYINPYTRRSYSLLSIPKATEAGMKSV